MWVFKLPFSVNRFEHIEHWNGFSPVCVRSWILSRPDLEYSLPQILQVNGLSPVWMSMCVCRCPFVMKLFWQSPTEH